MTPALHIVVTIGIACPVRCGSTWEAGDFGAEVCDFMGASLFCLFTGLAAGDGYAASQRSARADGLGDGMGT